MSCSPSGIEINPAVEAVPKDRLFICRWLCFLFKRQITIKCPQGASGLFRQCVWGGRGVGNQTFQNRPLQK